MGLIKVTFYITFVGIVILSSKISPCEPSRVILTEGELGVLEFEYIIVPNGEVQLTIGHRHPFYDAGNLNNAGLSESQRGRFSVVSVDGEVDRLVVKISNVSRKDAGTFHFYMLVNRVIEENYSQQQIVNIFTPPGKASCSPAFDVKYAYINGVEEIWTVIECFAPLVIDSDPVIFECYQSGEQTPFLTELSQNETTLMQKVSIKRSIRIYCCTSIFGKPKRRCSCNDYIWDPVSHVRLHGLDPCPPTTPLQGTSGDVTYSDQDDQTTTTGYTPAVLESLFMYPTMIILCFVVVFVLVLGMQVVNKKNELPVHSSLDKRMAL